MTVEERYEKLNGTIAPDDALVEITGQMMARERHVRTVTLDSLKKRALYLRAARRSAPFAAAAAALVLAAVLLPSLLAQKSAAADQALMKSADYSVAESGGTADSYATGDGVSSEETAGEACEVAGGDTGSESGYAVVYYVGEDGALASEEIWTESSPDAVLALWQEKNGLEGVTIASLSSDVQNGAVTVEVDLSGTLSDYLNDDGTDLLAESLMRTLAAYFNADTIVVDVDGKAL